MFFQALNRLHVTLGALKTGNVCAQNTEKLKEVRGQGLQLYKGFSKAFFPRSSHMQALDCQILVLYYVEQQR